MSRKSRQHGYMVDEAGASALEQWPTEHMPGLAPWKASVSNIELHLKVRAIVGQTQRALLEDPTRDLVSTLREAVDEFAPGDSRGIDWTALELIAGKRHSTIDRGRGQVTDKAVTRLRLSFVDLAKAVLYADESLRREADDQRAVNSMAMEVLRWARDVDTSDPMLARPRESSSPVLERLRKVSDLMRMSTDEGSARYRAVELLRPVAVAMERTRPGVSWTHPLDESLAAGQQTRDQGESIFDRAIDVAAEENIRLSLILRELPPRPTLLEQVRTHFKTMRSMPGQVRVAPVAAAVQLQH
jgi:hypothetical protein